MANQDDFLFHIRNAALAYLAGANDLAQAIDAAPEGTDVAYLWHCMEEGRKMADTFDPPEEDWPVNVVALDAYRKRAY